MQEYAAFGETNLRPYEAFADVAEFVVRHHERWGGAGYPKGLRGEEIRPLARAIAILDAFSAMVVDRPYHRRIPNPRRSPRSNAVRERRSIRSR